MIKDLLVSFFGDYVPNSIYMVGDDGLRVLKVLDGWAGVDFVWIFSAISFLVFLISFFRIIGKVISNV